MMMLGLLMGGCQEKSSTGQASTAEALRRPVPKLAPIPKSGGEDRTIRPRTSQSHDGAKAEVTRAGAVRLEAYRSTNVVRIDADPSLVLRGVDEARGGRTLGAMVGFTCRPVAGGADHAEVPNSADSVTLAVARQLEILEWVVELAAHKKMAAYENKSAPETETDKPVGQTKQPLTRFTFEGEVKFWVAVAPGKAQASIEARVRVVEGGKKIFDSTVRSSRALDSRQQPLVSKRVRMAQEGALSTFVRALFSSRELSQALVSSIRAANKAGR